MEENKEALLGRARSGARAALAELALARGPEVYRLALYLLHSEEEARDAAADIFARLYAAPGLLPRESFRPWLLRVAHNHCLNILRRRKTLARLLPKIYAKMSSGHGPNPEQAAVEADEQAEVRRAAGGGPAAGAGAGHCDPPLLSAVELRRDQRGPGHTEGHSGHAPAPGQGKAQKNAGAQRRGDGK